MRRQSTLWFTLAAAWSVLLVLNVLRHRTANTVVIGIAIAAFVAVGVIYRWRESKALRNKQFK
jgi:hypothetical protein